MVWIPFFKHTCVFVKFTDVAEHSHRLWNTRYCLLPKLNNSLIVIFLVNNHLVFATFYEAWKYIQRVNAIFNFTWPQIKYLRLLIFAVFCQDLVPFVCRELRFVSLDFLGVVSHLPLAQLFHAFNVDVYFSLWLQYREKVRLVRIDRLNKVTKLYDWLCLPVSKRALQIRSRTNLTFAQL